jgi:hypothetical protein
MDRQRIAGDALPIGRQVGALTDAEIQEFRKDLAPILREHGKISKVLIKRSIPAIKVNKVAKDQKPSSVPRVEPQKPATDQSPGMINVERNQEDRNEAEAAKRGIISTVPDPQTMTREVHPSNPWVQSYLETAETQRDFEGKKRLAEDPAETVGKGKDCDMRQQGRDFLGVHPIQGVQATFGSKDEEPEDNGSEPIDPRIAAYIHQCLTEMFGASLLHMERKDTNARKNGEEDGTDELPTAANPTGSPPVDRRAGERMQRHQSGTAGAGDEPPPFPGRPVTGTGPAHDVAMDGTRSGLLTPAQALQLAEDERARKRQISSTLGPRQAMSFGTSGAMEREALEINGRPSTSCGEFDAGGYRQKDKVVMAQDAPGAEALSQTSSVVQAAVKRIGAHIR